MKKIITVLVIVLLCAAGAGAWYLMNRPAPKPAAPAFSPEAQMRRSMMLSQLKSRAHYFMSQGKNGIALDLFKKILELDPQDKTAKEAIEKIEKQK